MPRWRHALRRRSQRTRLNWARFPTTDRPLCTALPGSAPILRRALLCVTSDLRQEPYAVIPLVRIRAGGGQQWPSLPRPHFWTAARRRCARCTTARSAARRASKQSPADHRPLQEKPAAATHWSTRSMAAAMGMSEFTVVLRIWHAHYSNHTWSRLFKNPRPKGGIFLPIGETLRLIFTLNQNKTTLGSPARLCQNIE